MRESMHVPPPIPEAAKKRKGPPPIPAEARKKVTRAELEDIEIDLQDLEGEKTRITHISQIKPPEKPKGPPPIPEAARRKKSEKLQTSDVIETFEISGFKNIEVAATLEKKNQRKGDPKNRNEDNFLADPLTGLVGVFDGLGEGGEPGSGALASAAAEAAIPKAYTRAQAELARSSISDVINRLAEHRLKKTGNASPEARIDAIRQAEELAGIDPKLAREALLLIEAIVGSNDSIKETKGKTTAVVSKVLTLPDGRRFLVAASIGDSLLVKHKASGEIEPITREDSAIQALIDAGEITPDIYAAMRREPNKIFDLPLSLKLVQAMGGNEHTLRIFEELKHNKDPKFLGFRKHFTFNNLKRAMTASLGSDTSFEPSLAYTELGLNESAYLYSDGISDVQENPTTGEFDPQQVLLDMSGYDRNIFLDDKGKFDERRLKGVVKTLTLKARVEKMRRAAAKRSNIKDDDKVIIGIK